MAYTVLIVDDDSVYRLVSRRILEKDGYSVLVAESGEKALTMLAENKIDLVLLDIRMPGMDGFEILERMNSRGYKMPVIFLTSEEDAEARGLKEGAADFISKSSTSIVMQLRVKKTLELDTLQRDLQSQVDIQTAELSEHYAKLDDLIRQTMMTLADTIDAKDHYTKGHSTRVAQYSREIAIRYGKSKEEYDMIYFTGLLHDIGKIGVPDEIINKPGRLTNEEFAQIKMHPTIGAGILAHMTTAIPFIADGARWHHERFDGMGYPDGLKGYEIPEIARIISVADAYDAMTSNRSYRKILPQARVREEIEKGLGTQFDETFGKIMLQMIDDDKSYSMTGLNRG